MNRVNRNFWILVSATVVAVSLLSTAVRMPPSPFAGTLTAVSGLGAAASLALAARILLVTTRSSARGRGRVGIPRLWKARNGRPRREAGPHSRVPQR